VNDLAAIIERVRRVSDSTQRLDVAVEGAARVQPGQHFLARLTESWDPYLREPWIPVKTHKNTVTFERPSGTVYQPGQFGHLLGPIGQPIRLTESARTLLLIAYDTTPTSLLMLAGAALKRKMSVTLALVGAARHYALEALPPELEIVRGDDRGEWPEQRASISWADQIVAVALPHDPSHYIKLLEMALRVRVELPHGYVSGLFQPPLPCGIGACRACLVACHRHELLACVEGPAFDLLRVTLR
jgi:dihydroorotate dehydrogenase electron transfer subunit